MDDELVLHRKPEATMPAVKTEGLTATEIAQALRTVQLESSEHQSEKQIFPYRIVGNETTVVEIDLQAGEAVRAEAGSLVAMDSTVVLDTSTGTSLFIYNFF